MVKIKKYIVWASVNFPLLDGHELLLVYEYIPTPKDVGGLSIQAAKGRNTVLLAKLNWRFHTERESQWAKVLTLKY